MSGAKNYSDFIRSLASKYAAGQPLAPNPSLPPPEPGKPFPNPFMLPGSRLPFPSLAAVRNSIPTVGNGPIANPMMNPRSPLTSLSLLASVGSKPNPPIPGSPLDIQTQALINVMKTAQQYHQKLIQERQENNPKDDEEEMRNVKRVFEGPPAGSEPQPKKPKTSNSRLELSLCSQIAPCSHEAKMIKDWTVEEVCEFVMSVELCQPYVQVGTAIPFSFLTP